MMRKAQEATKYLEVAIDLIENRCKLEELQGIFLNNIKLISWIMIVYFSTVIYSYIPML
jgi:hypothetical protein